MKCSSHKLIFSLFTASQWSLRPLGVPGRGQSPKNSGIRARQSCIGHCFNECFRVTPYAKSVGKGNVFPCNSLLFVVQNSTASTAVPCKMSSNTLSAMPHLQLTHMFSALITLGLDEATYRQVWTGSSVVAGWAPGAVPHGDQCFIRPPCAFRECARCDTCWVNARLMLSLVFVSTPSPFWDSVWWGSKRDWSSASAQVPTQWPENGSKYFYYCHCETVLSLGQDCLTLWAREAHRGSGLPSNTQFQGNQTQLITLILYGGQKKRNLDVSGWYLFVRKSFCVKQIFLLWSRPSQKGSERLACYFCPYYTQKEESLSLSAVVPCKSNMLHVPCSFLSVQLRRRSHPSLKGLYTYMLRPNLMLMTALYWMVTKLTASQLIKWELDVMHWNVPQKLCRDPSRVLIQKMGQRWLRLPMPLVTAKIFWSDCSAETVVPLITAQVTDLTFSNSLKGDKLKSVDTWNELSKMINSTKKYMKITRKIVFMNI